MSEQTTIATPCVFGETGNILLERELGIGGMGGVYMGRDKMLDRALAVKIMLKKYGSDTEFIEKFKREAQSSARLIHPNIAQIYSYGISDGMPYIAMELVAGGSLYNLMKNSPGGTDVARVLKICEQIAQALRCASDQGVVHGDIKPENILLDANGNAKLVDFGLAAMQNDTSEIWGTPYYISPEKVNKQVIDYRSDMYSLGGTLYHALTGVAPFEGKDSDEVVRKRFEGPCKKPSEVRPGLSPQIDALVMKMLAFDREERFPTFEALLDAMKKVMSSGLVAGSPSSSVQQEVDAGGKKILKVRSRKKFVAKRSDSGEESESAVPKRLRVSDDEESDNSGSKLALVIVGIILGLCAIGGLLSWYVIADKKAKERQRIEQIDAGFAEARLSLEKLKSSALERQKKFDDFAQTAVLECEKTTAEMAKLFPGEIAKLLKPGPTKELLDAIESTKEKEPAVVEEPVAGEDKKEAGGVAPSTEKPAAAPVKPKQFRPPFGDEADPNSPEGEKYLEEKRKWEAKNAVENVAKQSAEQVAEQAESTEAAPAMEIPQEVKFINDLWGRAYSCKACAIIIHHRIDKLVQEIDAYQVGERNESTLKAIGDFTTKISAQYDEIKASEEFTKVSKAIGYVTSKGKKIVEDTIKRLRTERLQKEREEKARKEKEGELKRLAEIEEARKKLIAEEIESINTKFTSLADTGVFRQLDWKGAKRQLNALKGDFQTAEGVVEADFVLRKVDAMEFVHKIMIRNLKDYVFEKGRTLRGMKVIEVDEKEMRILGIDKKTVKKMNWPRFYRDHHGNLNELFNKFVVRGRRNGTPRLRPKEWSEAMFGAALTMFIICPDDNAAAKRAPELAKEAVRQFDAYRELAKKFFPNINFDEVKSEE